MKLQDLKKEELIQWRRLFYALLLFNSIAMGINLMEERWAFVVLFLAIVVGLAVKIEDLSEEIHNLP